MLLEPRLPVDAYGVNQIALDSDQSHRGGAGVDVPIDDAVREYLDGIVPRRN